MHMHGLHVLDEKFSHASNKHCASLLQVHTHPLNFSFLLINEIFALTQPWPQLRNTTFSRLRSLT